MLGYRALLSVPHGSELIERSHEQLHAWLRSKNYDADLFGGGGTHQIAAGVTGTLLQIAERDGSEHLRARIVEAKRHDQTWTTELTVHRAARRQPGWVGLDVSGPEEGPLAATPNLAKCLLDVRPTPSEALDYTPSMTLHTAARSTWGTSAGT